MALSLLFSPLTTQQGSIDQITFDATISELHRGESRVANHPVESNNISDHIIHEPLKITIEGFVTNSPYSGYSGDRVQNTFDALFALRDEKKVMTVVSGLKVYNNMGITNITAPRDRSSGDSITFTVDLQEIVKSDFSSVLTPLDILPFGRIKDQASSRLDLGRQLPAQASPAITNAARDVIGRFF